MSELIESGLPCEACGSSDGKARYIDHTYCFVCEHMEWDNKIQRRAQVSIDLAPLRDLTYVPLGKRKISLNTCKRFNYGLINVGTNNVKQVASFFKGHELKAQHLRDKHKNFVIAGSTEFLSRSLWGRHIYGDTGGHRLLITEGQIDCLTAYEAMQTENVHVVSIPNGVQSAKKAIQANLKFIDRYSEVQLCFDNDEAGAKAIDLVAPSINPSKLKIYNIPPEHKDLNDYYLAEGPGALIKSLYNPKEYKPETIINASEVIKHIGKTLEPGIPYPLEGVTEVTGGMHKHDFICIAGGTGCGKTTFFKQMEHALLKAGERVGIIHLEEQNETTLLSLMAIDSGTAYHKPDNGLTVEQTKEDAEVFAIKYPFVMYDKSKGFEAEQIIETIRFMALGLNCKYIFLDHFTAMIDLCSTKRDPNQYARNIVVELGKLAACLPICLAVISHLRKTHQGGRSFEEGGKVSLDDLYGAAALKQWCTDIWSVERNQQAETKEARNSVTLRCLKERLSGNSGMLVYAKYSQEDFSLKEITKDEFNTNVSSKSSRDDNSDEVDDSSFGF